MNEAELTGLRARNCATIQQVFILKFAFGPEKLPCLSRNGLLDIVETAYFVRDSAIITWRGGWKIRGGGGGVGENDNKRGGGWM